MKFKIKQIKPLRIWHVLFEKQMDMTLSFLRVQEFYESPKFKDNNFDLDEYIQWYCGKYKKPFDYHLEVGAHNIPGHAFDSFMHVYEGMLSRKEMEVLEEIWEVVGDLDEEKYYILATCKDIPDHDGYFEHELRHAFFYLIPEYKRDILEVVKRFSKNRNVKKFVSALSKDYGKNVLKDELQAYALTSYNPYDEAKRIMDLPKGLRELRKELKTVEKKYYKNGKVV